MNKIDLLPVTGTFYKANLHCHTIHSDGMLTPEEVKDCYLAKGYSVVAFTDHRKYSDFTRLNDESFLAIAAMEADINELDNAGGDFSKIKTYHFNFYDTDPEFCKNEKMVLKQPDRRYFDMEYINGYVQKMKELGFIACYNHPYWSLQTYEDYRNLRGLWAMEIYNYGCEQDGLYGYHPQVYDEMLRSGQRLFCVSVDDNHNSYPFSHPFNDSFGGFTMISAKELSYAGVLDALLAGNFYASMGPEIYEISLTGNCLRIRTSPVKKIYVCTEGRNCQRKAAGMGETITEAEFVINGKEGWLRLDIQDENGRHANSNAYFLDDINKKQWEER